MGIFKKQINDFPTPYTVKAAVTKGGIETKLSMLVMGLGNIAHKQLLKGILFLTLQIIYIVFMITNGFHCLAMRRLLVRWSRKKCGTKHCKSMNIHREIILY